MVRVQLKMLGPVLIKVLPLLPDVLRVDDPQMDEVLALGIALAL